MIFEGFTTRTPGSVIEGKNGSITWPYRIADPKVSTINSGECRSRLKGLLAKSPANLEVMNGKMCLEVRPRSVNKGVIVQRILSEYLDVHKSPSSQRPRGCH